MKGVAPRINFARSTTAVCFTREGKGLFGPRRLRRLFETLIIKIKY